MLKTLTTAVLLAVAGAAFAQNSPTAPSTSPNVAPSQTPAVTPSQGPIVSPAPVTPPAAVGGLSRCANMIGTERDSCMQQERAGTGGTAGSTTSGTSTQPTAPIGSPTGTVR